MPRGRLSQPTLTQAEFAAKWRGVTTKEKQARVAVAADLWVPAVNNWGRLGRWTFLEVTHMETAAELIRSRYLT
jgi:hypothetical protein